MGFLFRVLVCCILFVSFGQHPATANTVIFEKTGGLIPTGYKVQALLRGPDGWIYGTTAFGGKNKSGVFFRANSGSGAVETLGHFGGSLGVHTDGTLAIDSSGRVYGTSRQIQSSETSILWRWSSATGIEVIAQFSPGLGGFQHLAIDSEGRVYSPCIRNGQKVLGRWSEQNGLESVALFQVLNTIALPAMPIAADENGNIFGTLPADGAGGLAGAWKWNATDGLARIATFEPEPYGTIAGGVVTQGGAVFGYVRGGAIGAIWKWDSTNGMQWLANFNALNGMVPTTSIGINSTGQLFGIAKGGGSIDGRLWRWDSAAGLELIGNFTGNAAGQEPVGGVIPLDDGNVFGATLKGAHASRGSFWRWSPSGLAPASARPPLALFDSDVRGMIGVFETPSRSYGILPPRPTHPTGALVTFSSEFEDPSMPLIQPFEVANVGGAVTRLPFAVDSEDAIYGFAYSGHENKSFLWKKLPGQPASSFKIGFIEGECAAALRAPDGTIYVTTKNGQTHGTLWKWTAQSNYQQLATFDESRRTPIGQICLDASGNLFGVTRGSSSFGPGSALWRWNAGNGLVTLAQFSVLPAYPDTGVAIGPDQLVYGTRRRTDGSHEVWKWDGTKVKPVASRNSFEFATGTDITISPVGSIFAFGKGDLYGSTVSILGCVPDLAIRSIAGIGEPQTLAALNGSRIGWKESRLSSIWNDSLWTYSLIPPPVSLVSVSDIDYRSATITAEWEYLLPISGYLDWGTHPEALIHRSGLEEKSNQNSYPSVRLDTLPPNSTIYYRMTIKGLGGTGSSPIGSFQTPSALSDSQSETIIENLISGGAATDVLFNTTAQNPYELRISAIEPPRFGTARTFTLNNSKQGISFQPSPDFGRSESVSFTISDKDGVEEQGVATFKINKPFVKINVSKGQSFPLGRLIADYEGFRLPSNGVFRGSFVTSGGSRRNAVFADREYAPLLFEGLLIPSLEARIGNLSSPSGNAVVASLQRGGKVTALNNHVLFTGRDLDYPAIRTGDPVPGEPGCFWHSIRSFDGHGETVFALVNIRGKDVNASNNGVLAAIPPEGPIQILAREGDPLDSREIRTISIQPVAPGTAAENRWRKGSRSCLVKITFTDGFDALYSVLHSEEGVTTVTLLALEGMEIGESLRTITRLGSAVAVDDKFAAAATLSPQPGGKPSDKKEVILRKLNNELQIVAASGDPARDRSSTVLSGTFIRKLGAPLLGHEGRVVSLVNYNGPEVPPGTAQAIVSFPENGNPREIARLGDKGPEDWKWVRFLSIAVPDQPEAGLLFTALATRPGVKSTKQGLWGEDSTGAIVELLLEGKTYFLNGKHRELTSFSALTSAPDLAGSPQSGYANNHRVFALGTFRDGTRAVLQISIP